MFLFAQESRSYSVYCLTPENSCLIYSVGFYSCLWREDYSVAAGSANDSPSCFSFRESQPHTGMLMTKCLHLITAHSKKTFWTPDKSITSFSLRGDHVLYLLLASESFLTAAQIPPSFLLLLLCWATLPISRLHMTAYTEVSSNKFWGWDLSVCLGKEAVSIRFQSSPPLGSASLTREERCQFP